MGKQARLLLLLMLPLCLTIKYINEHTLQEISIYNLLELNSISGINSATHLHLLQTHKKTCKMTKRRPFVSSNYTSHTNQPCQKRSLQQIVFHFVGYLERRVNNERQCGKCFFFLRVCFQVACRTFITFMYKEFPLLKDASEISNLTRTKEIATSNQLNLISRTNEVHMEWDQRRIRNRLNLKSRG